MDSNRASTLELLGGLLTRREVLRPSEPHLSLSLVYKEWTWEHYRKLNLTFFTFFARRSRGIFIGGLSQCFGWKWGSGGPLIRPASHLGWPGGQVSWPHRLSHLRSSSYRLNMTHVESVILLAPNLGRPAPPWVGWARAFCHVISPCHIIWDYPLFWT
jgi:hypothetical protein